MPHAAYPTASDLDDYLEAAGFPAALRATLDLTTAVGAGIRAVEMDTRRTFLWTAALPEARRFDPPLGASGTLYLPYDLAALTSIVYQPYGGSAATLAVDVDYELLPFNAALAARPYEAINLLYRRWSEPLAGTMRRSITITGKWAYSATEIPDDVWRAMLAAAAGDLFAQLVQATTGGLLSIKEADVAEDYGVETWTRLQKGWESSVETVVRRYRRLTLEI